MTITITNEEVCDRLLPAIRAVADHNESQVLLFVDNLTPVIKAATATLEDLARLATDLDALSRDRDVAPF